MPMMSICSEKLEDIHPKLCLKMTGSLFDMAHFISFYRMEAASSSAPL